MQQTMKNYLQTVFQRKRYTAEFYISAAIKSKLLLKKGEVSGRPLILENPCDCSPSVQ